MANGLLSLNPSPFSNDLNSSRFSGFVMALKNSGLKYSASISFARMFLSRFTPRALASVNRIVSVLRKRLHCRGLPLILGASTDEICLAKAISILHLSAMSPAFSLNKSIVSSLSGSMPWTMSKNLLNSLLSASVDSSKRQAKYWFTSAWLSCGIVIGYCITFSRYSLPISRLFPGTSLYLLLIAYCIRRSSAPITKDIPSTKRNKRIASNTSRTVSGRHRSSSSMNTTTFSTLLFFNSTWKSLRKFLISALAFSSFFSLSSISSISLACKSLALALTEERMLLRVRSVRVPTPPVKKKSKPYFIPFPSIFLKSIFFISSLA